MIAREEEKKCYLLVIHMIRLDPSYMDSVVDSQRAVSGGLTKYAKARIPLIIVIISVSFLAILLLTYGLWHWNRYTTESGFKDEFGRFLYYYEKYVRRKWQREFVSHDVLIAKHKEKARTSDVPFTPMPRPDDDLFKW